VSDDSDPNSQISLQGQLLLADPSMRDGIFHRSVVYLSEHDDDNGAFGVILNKPSEHKVRDLLNSDEFSTLKNLRVFIGGPVAQEHMTFAALRWSTKRGLCIETRISAQEASQRASTPGTLVRAFVGYSGWTAGQLEGELRQNTWITKKPSERILQRGHEDTLWAETLREISPFHELLAEAPIDPFLN